MLVTSITYVAGWVIGDLALRRRLGGLAHQGDARAGARAIAAVSAVAGVVGWARAARDRRPVRRVGGRLARKGADRYRGHRRRGSRRSRGRPRSGGPGAPGCRQGPDGTRMTESSQEASPPPERSPRRSVQDRGSTVSMTSTTTGLPDRYRPIDQVGPDEPTPTGVIQCWRAKDRVLNRDVAIRVHTPAGPAAHAWISRALTAGGLATPALAMVYDASEGTGDPQAARRRRLRRQRVDRRRDAGRAAQPRPDARPRGPHRPPPAGRGRRRGAPGRPGRRRPQPRERRAAARTGWSACAACPGRDRHHRRRHRRPRRAARGLPHRAAPPADEAPAPSPGPPTCVALVRRARSTEPGQGLSSVAAMASLLAERPRTGPGRHVGSTSTAPSRTATTPTAAGCAGSARQPARGRARR